MAGPEQLEFLKAAKSELGTTWDELAVLAGIEPRALKTYHMPPESTNYRNMPNLARNAIASLLESYRTKRKKHLAKHK